MYISVLNMLMLNKIFLGQRRVFDFVPSLTVRRFIWKGRKRFFKQTGIESTSDGLYGITLDGKRVKTPNRKELTVKTPGLAKCLAHEFNMQENVIRPATMPLMVLACSAIDVSSESRGQLYDELLRYLKTDTLCYKNPISSKLYQSQVKLWDPIIKNFENIFGKISVQESMKSTNHPKGTVDNVRIELDKFDEFELAALESLTGELKSLILALSLLKNLNNTSNLVISGQDAVQLSRLEEEHQIQEWGLVEGGHDVDRANCLVQVMAAVAFVRLQSKH